MQALLNGLSSAGSVSAVTLTANDLFVVPAVVLLASLEGNIRKHVEIVIRDTGLSRSSRELLTAQARSLECPIQFEVQTSSAFDQAQLLSHWTSADSFCRLLPLESIAGSHRYVLHLDADLLVRKSVEPLMGLIPSDGCILAAVPAHFAPGLWFEEVGPPDDFGRSASDSFFMGGVMVVDNHAWFEEKVSHRAIQAFTAAPNRWRSDLSVLNVVVGRSWTPLDYQWNVWTLATAGPLRFVRTTGAAERSVVRRSTVGIAHFPGSLKPWLPHYPLNAWRVEYARAARRSVLPRDMQPGHALKVDIGRALRRFAWSATRLGRPDPRADEGLEEA